VFCVLLPPPPPEIRLGWTKEAGPSHITVGPTNRPRSAVPRLTSLSWLEIWRAVAAARSRLFACLVLLMLATVGVFAVEHCHCDDVTADCEHAGQACAQPDDCTDCSVPSVPVALGDSPLALLPPANVLSEVCLVPVLVAYLERGAVELAEHIFSSPSLPSRPPAFRAGTMCLRI